MTRGVSCPAGDRLSAFLDGDLPAGDAQAVRAHVQGCAACTRAAAELRAVVGATRSLERPEPPPTLWPAVEGALGGSSRRERRPSRRGWGVLARPFSFSWRPFGAGAVAGAAVATAVALLAGMRGRPMEPSSSRSGSPSGAPVAVAAAVEPVDPMLEEAEAEFARAAGAYERSIEKLRALLERETVRWTPDERTRYAERLARIDEAIVRSREVARRTPADSAGNEQLFAAYQQKIAFLAAAVHRGGPFGESAP